MISFPMYHSCVPFDNTGISINVVVDIQGVTKPEDLGLTDIEDIICGLKALIRYYQDLYNKEVREMNFDLS